MSMLVHLALGSLASHKPREREREKTKKNALKKENQKESWFDWSSRMGRWKMTSQRTVSLIERYDRNRRSHVAKQGSSCVL